MLQKVLLSWGVLSLVLALTASVRLYPEIPTLVVGIDVTALDQEPSICDDFPNLPVCP